MAGPTGRLPTRSSSARARPGSTCRTSSANWVSAGGRKPRRSRSAQDSCRRPASCPPEALFGEALFLPGVGVVVVAVALPETELVVVEELETADPLGALPEVALGNEEPERVAVLPLERLAAERVGQHDVVVVEDAERQVRRIA